MLIMLVLLYCSFLMVFGSSILLLFLLFFLPLCFSVKQVLLTYLQAHWCIALLCSVYKSSQKHSSFLLVILISSIPFWFFLSVSISLFPLPSWFCTLSIIFSTRTFHILILAVLNSQPDKSKISDTSASGSNACFVSLEWVFSNFKHALQFSCLKPDKVYQVIGTEINWHLLWGFMFIF